MKKILSFFILTLFTAVAFAQNNESGMAVDLRESGKIYVVVAVITVVFIGLFVYLYTMDRRMKKLEREK